MLYEARQPVRFNYIMAALCTLLSILGFLVAGVIPSESTTNHGADPLVGWGIVIVCVAVAAIFVRRASDRRVLVRADANGLYSRLYSDTTIPWSAIAGVRLLHFRNFSILRVKLVDPRAWPGKGGVVGALDNRVSYGELGINPRFYDHGVRELFATIVHYRPDLAV